MPTLDTIFPRTARSRTSNLVVLAALAGPVLAACQKSASDEQTTALASARQAQVRAEAELKAMKEAAALPTATTAQPTQPQEPPVPAATPAEPTTTNSLPDPGRIKGDLVGRTFRGGMLTKYNVESLSSFLAFKVLNRQVAGNVVEYTLDTTLRKDAASSKRCFAALRATYRRAAETDPWTFGEVTANTFTCE